VNKLNRVVLIVLSTAIMVMLGFIVYLNVAPQAVNKFTQFYVLNAEGQAEDYPDVVIAGNPVDVIVGVVNHEYEPASYKIYVDIDSKKVEEVNVGTLAYQQKWEKEVSFSPQTVGDKQTVDFTLYKDNGTEPYIKEPLRLYIDVVSP
jgi:uncharacterized membrane protein